MSDDGGFLKTHDIIELTSEMVVYNNDGHEVHPGGTAKYNPWYTAFENGKEVRKKTYIPPVGEYEVVETKVCGAGYGHGPHDKFPAGHEVNAMSKANGDKVRFYQSGCFTAMIPPNEIQAKYNVESNLILNKEELDLIRQWYNAVKDLNPKYLEKKDKDLMDKIMIELTGKARERR